MPTQLQLEGRELAPLLDRVRSELGPHARILSAEKVRSGGIGGFFARQRFELTVEVDDLPAEPATSGSAAVTSSAGPAAAPASLLELADRVSDHEHAAAVSTETPSFTSLLSRLGVSIDGSPAPSAAAHVPAPAGRPAAAAVAAAAVGAPPPSLSPVPVPAPRRPTEPSVTTAAQTATGQPSAAVALRDGDTPALPCTTTTSVAVALVPETGTADDVRATGELSRLGLPLHLQPADGDDPVYPALLQTLRRLPRAPRTANRGGEVLAVVGPLHLALDLARQLAGDLGLPLASAVFAATDGPVDTEVSARQQVQDVDTAVTHRATWRRRRNLTVVAIDAPLTSAGAQQARSYLAAFGPTAVWGVVEATRKPQDVGAWTRAVGGVHALALTGVEETADPAAVLALGIPVGRLGSRAATPAVWASLLTGRLVS